MPASDTDKVKEGALVFPRYVTLSVVGGVVLALASTLVSAGAAWQRLSVVEKNILDEAQELKELRKELSEMRAEIAALKASAK